MTMLSLIGPGLRDHTALRQALLANVKNWKALNAPPGAWLLDQFLAENGEDFHRYSAFQPQTRWRPKECFLNAMTAVNFHPRSLRYVEGYLYNRKFGVAFLHAWAVDPAGDIVETSLNLLDDGRAADHLYLGIAFDRDTYADAADFSDGISVWDTGRGVNRRWIFQLAPDLRLEVEAYLAKTRPSL